MALQTQFAAQEGRGEAYWTGANGVVVPSVDAPTAGKSFAVADVAGNFNANSPLAEVKHADFNATGGPAYYTTDGTAPDATIGFPLLQDGIMSQRNCRALIKTLKFFVPVGTTLHASWSA